MQIGCFSRVRFGPRELAATLQEYADAGVDELFVQQIGPEQEAFFTTWAEEILPRFR